MTNKAIESLLTATVTKLEVKPGDVVVFNFKDLDFSDSDYESFKAAQKRLLDNCGVEIVYCAGAELSIIRKESSDEQPAQKI